MKGKIKWYNEIKGFGFIEVEGEKDVFVHRSALGEGVKVREGEMVEFEVEDSPKGPQATKVSKE